MHLTNTSIIYRALATFLIGGLVQAGWSDPPPLQWAKGQGTPLGEHVIEGIQTQDGGFCLVGKTDEPGRDWADGLVIKINAQGELEWQQRIGARKSQEELRCITEVSDGYLIGGTFSGSEKKSQAGICKLDRSGTVLWTTLLPHKRFGAVRGVAIDQAGYLVGTGYTDLEEYKIPFIADEAIGVLFKMDQQGEIQWQQSLPLAQGSKVDVHPSDGVIAVCGTQWRATDKSSKREGQEGKGVREDHQDGCLLLFDENGTQLGQRFFGGPHMDQLFDLDPTHDGWVLAGHSMGIASGWDVWIVRVNADGMLLWQKRFGQPLGGDKAFVFDECYGVKSAGDGGFLLACGSGIEPENVHDQKDKRNVWAAYLIKTDRDGALEWEYIFHRPDEGHNACEWVIPVREGGYLMLLDSDHLGEASEENIGLLKLGNPSEGS